MSVLICRESKEELNKVVEDYLVNGYSIEEVLAEGVNHNKDKTFFIDRSIPSNKYCVVMSVWRW